MALSNFDPADIWSCACVCHEANRALQLEFSEIPSPPWDEAEEWMRESSYNGVLFLVKNPESSFAALHDNWVLDKLADGWRYGPIKNTDTKEHPCLVDYNDLSIQQRRKDMLFKAIVTALLLVDFE